MRDVGQGIAQHTLNGILHEKEISHGLGLYTARTLVKQTGGVLKLVSKMNVGTHVEFSVMVAKKKMEVETVAELLMEHRKKERSWEKQMANMSEKYSQGASEKYFKKRLVRTHDDELDPSSLKGKLSVKKYNTEE